jgi:cytidylate kinase
MALLTISGDPASRWEEVAHGAAQLLGFELVTEARLAQWMAEEFGDATIPGRAWKPAATAVLTRLATEHHLVVAVDGAEHLFPPLPLLLRARILAPETQRAGNLMLDERLEKPEALARLRELDAEHKRLRKARFGRASSSADRLDLTIHTARIDPSQATEMLAGAASARKLPQQGLLSSDSAAELQFETRLRLARHGIAPAGHAQVKRASFGHPSEEMFANLLDFYRIQWDYEPRSFPLQWDKNGNVIEAFTPDFYLAEFDLYVELTTMKQALVTRKNRKIKLLRAIYPHVNIQVFYQKDFQDLVFKYGLKTAS